MLQPRFLISRFARYAVLLLAVLPFVAFGCDRKEKVLDLETPGVDVEVERSVDDGSLDVEIDDN